MKKLSLLLIMVLLAMTAKAYTFYSNVEIGNFKYSQLALGSSSSEENIAYLKGLSNTASTSLTTLDIPGYVTYNGNRYRVTQINQQAFENNTNITTVNFGYGVENIGGYVFNGCTSLKYVNLPSSVKEIGQFTFQNCTSLLVVAFAGEKAPKIYDYTFNLSSASKKASTATYRGMNALKADSKWVAAFGASNILRHYSYKVGDFKVYNSTNGCWQYYMIKNGIPYNGNSSNPSVRSSCVLVAATFTDGSNYRISLPQSVGNSDNNPPGGYKFYGVADSAFMGNTSITQVTNNSTMAYKIGVRSFYGCSSLTSADVPVDTIGDYAFYNCSNLATVNFASSLGNLVYLGSYAFGACGFTGTVTIPATTKLISYAPFYSCPSLQKIAVDANNTNYCSYKDALYNKAKTMLYQIPCQWQYGKNGDDIDNNITDFPETLQRVLQYAASGTNIKYLYLPYNVKYIDQYAFQNCKYLFIVHLPSSVTTVEDYAFKGCDGIRVVYLNKSTPPNHVYFDYDLMWDWHLIDLYVPYDGEVAYQNSSSLSTSWWRFNIKIGTYDHTNCYDIATGGVRYTVTSEEGYSHNGFTGDGKLKVVGILAGTRTIPPTLNYGGRTYVPYIIGEYAAFSEEGSYTINQAQSISIIQEGAFAGKKLTNFPFINLERIRKYAFAQNEMNFDLDLTNFQYLVDIGYGAFEGSGITKFVSPISTSVDIGGYAFNDCQNLHEMFLYDATTGTNFIGNNASDFKCWINYRKLEGYLASGHYSTFVIRPYLRLDSEWQSFSCYKPINFEGTGVEAYTVTAYDKNQKKVTLSNVAKLEEKNGAVVHGNVGSYYRLNYATGSNFTTSQYLKAVNSSGYVNSNTNTSRFEINATKPQFDKITESTFFYTGSSYLELNTSDTGGATTIYTNLSGTVVVPGDVNGDGTVTAADITALYDVLLNNDYSHVVNGDQTGDNIITAADVTAVYTILLSN